jgi:hypothetical protein
LKGSANVKICHLRLEHGSSDRATAYHAPSPKFKHPLQNTKKKKKDLTYGRINLIFKHHDSLTLKDYTNKKVECEIRCNDLFLFILFLNIFRTCFPTAGKEEFSPLGKINTLFLSVFKLLSNP